MDNSAFNFANGMISALETRLLHSNDIERMLGTKSVGEAYRVFNDAGFVRDANCPGADKPENFQCVINTEMESVQRLLKQIVRADQVWTLDILWVHYDFHNLKVALKAKVLGWREEEAKTMLVNIGAIPALEMFNFGYHDVKTERITRRFERAKENALKAYSENHKSREIDFMLDADLYDLKRYLAGQTENDFLREFVVKEIDVYNITTFFRFKHIYPELDFGQWFTEGGEIAREVFATTTEALVEKLKNTHYRKMALAYEIFGRTQEDFSALEREGQEILTSHMRRTKHMPLGGEKIFSYFWAKDNNADILRTIMVGKLAGVPQEKIRSRLPRLFND